MEKILVNLVVLDYCLMIEQEGQKPCQIISPHLNVGGRIKREASNGRTEIVINDRVITSTERLMLKVIMLGIISLFRQFILWHIRLTISY